MDESTAQKVRAIRAGAAAWKNDCRVFYATARRENRQLDIMSQEMILSYQHKLTIILETINKERVVMSASRNILADLKIDAASASDTEWLAYDTKFLENSTIVFNKASKLDSLCKEYLIVCKRIDVLIHHMHSLSNTKIKCMTHRDLVLSCMETFARIMEYVAEYNHEFNGNHEMRKFMMKNA